MTPELTGEKQRGKSWFKPGQSGNPAGRPKGRFSVTTLIIKELENNPEKTAEIVQWLLANRKDLVWKMIDSEPPKDLNLGQNPELPFKIIIEQPHGERTES